MAQGAKNQKTKKKKKKKMLENSVSFYTRLGAPVLFF